MEIHSIRCDICGLELYYKNSKDEKELEIHKPIKIGSITIGNDTSYPFEGKHFCGSECILEAIKSVINGEPLEKDRLEALAEKLGYSVIKKKEKKENETET